ncbi:MAG: thioredoxin domain-containing protein [Verrucomicrobiota bacterium]|nr:thioredoxin domain-containing protein [Verrucomicrobiota bacterium]
MISRLIPATLALACLAWFGCNQPNTGSQGQTKKENSEENKTKFQDPTQKEAVMPEPKNSKGTKHKFTNRLAKEKSPYLEQHKHNPVNWFPWGEEAFAKAKKENKPIFLSIGYSTCHWCHVMERESFEKEEVAEILNKHFVNIKLDREERPDIDRIYMACTVMINRGNGGWPMTVFMTPDKKPFFAGTYFPKRQFMKLATQVGTLWADKEKEKRLREDADKITNLVSENLKVAAPKDAQLKPDYIETAISVVKRTFDPDHGGFGQPGRWAPKFPQPSEPALLLRYGVEHDDQKAVDMVLKTCDEMADGGIYDHIGGGFSRYSVDRKWLVPHFEKMLYDNAQLVHLYLDAYLVSGKTKYADVAVDIIRYVLRDMTHEEGGFYSAEDADSEGHEGKFYCWTKAELEKLLTKEEATVVIRHYGVTEHGNFEDHSHPEPLKNQNVLSIVDTKLSDPERKLLESAKAKMFKERAKRIRPHLDDKILSSWNGLMLGALARAHSVLGKPEFLKAAEKNLAFTQAKLWDAKTKTLYHRWRDNERDKVQLLHAYGYQLGGVVELYESTLNPDHLAFAINLAEGLLQRFHDKEAGGFWTAQGSDDLIVHLKEERDGAEPAAASVALLALLKLGLITERKDFTRAAEGTLRLYAKTLEQKPHALPHMLSGLDFWLHKPWRTVIAGKSDDAQVAQLVDTVHRIYQPNKVVLGNVGAVEKFARTLEPGASGPVVYICSGQECKLPTADPKEIHSHLQKTATSRNQPAGGGSPLIQLEPGKKPAPQKKPDK